MAPDLPSPFEAALVDARALDDATARLFSRRGRLVGWGSGSVFDYFHGLYPVPLEAIVDNDGSRWGQTRRGIPIVGPSYLDTLDEPALVILYSAAWPDIRAQIGCGGRHRAVPASALFADAGARARLAWSERLTTTPPPPREPLAHHAVVVQGPVVPGVTDRVLALTRVRQAGARIILSTWDDTPPGILTRLNGAYDDLVRSRRPAVAGVQNRNAQIVSTRAGLAQAAAAGARTVLKTRTDLAVLADDVFARTTHWLASFDGRGPARWGRAGRIVVPSTFTRRYLLYHPSDMVMLGEIDDLRTFWSAPLDPRTGDLLSPEWLDETLTAANLAGHPAESYLGTAYGRAVGRPLLGTLEDSWAFYRDLFAVVDNDWFDLLWFKNLAIPDLAVRDGVRSTITQAFWERLAAGADPAAVSTEAVDPSRLTLRALTGLAA